MGILYSTYKSYNDENSNDDNNIWNIECNTPTYYTKSINPNPIYDYTWYFHNKQEDNGITILNI
jgi:hypothetical protein